MLDDAVLLLRAAQQLQLGDGKVAEHLQRVVLVSSSRAEWRCGHQKTRTCLPESVGGFFFF